MLINCLKNKFNDRGIKYKLWVGTALAHTIFNIISVLFVKHLLLLYLDQQFDMTINILKRYLMIRMLIV